METVTDTLVEQFTKAVRSDDSDKLQALMRESPQLKTIIDEPLFDFDAPAVVFASLHSIKMTETLLDLGNNYVFADAPDLSPAIQIVRKTSSTPEHLAQAAVFVKGEGITKFKDQLPDKLFAVSIHDQLDTGWRLTGKTIQILLPRLIERGKPLGEIVQGQMYRGVLTGLNEAFIIDQATRDRLITPLAYCAR